MAVISVLLFFCILTDIGMSTDDMSIQSLENLIQQQSTIIQDQAAQLQALQSKVNSLESQLVNVATDTSVLKAIHPKQAASSVTFGTQQPLNVGANAAIKFDKVVTNVGNGYTPRTGLFTAPYAGVYAFFVSLRSNNHHNWVMLGIYKGNILLVDVTEDGSIDLSDRGTAFVMTHVNKGEQVYVRHNGGDTFIESGPFTTFSGVLVMAD